jgi:hypothetical protein
MVTIDGNGVSESLTDERFEAILDVGREGFESACSDVVAAASSASWIRSSPASVRQQLVDARMIAT